MFLELPLRAGPFRAPLVYGAPDTWDGFWYIVLAEQFRGSVSEPVQRPGRQGCATSAIATVAAFGPLAIVIPVAFVGDRRWRRPRYALLTGSPFVLTVLLRRVATSTRTSSRYYRVPMLGWRWTWLRRRSVRRDRPRGDGDVGRARGRLGPATASRHHAADATGGPTALLGPRARWPIAIAGGPCSPRFARRRRSRRPCTAQRWVDRTLAGSMAPDASS